MYNIGLLFKKSENAIFAGLVTYLVAVAPILLLRHQFFFYEDISKIIYVIISIFCFPILPFASGYTFVGYRFPDGKIYDFVEVGKIPFDSFWIYILISLAGALFHFSMVIYRDYRAFNLKEDKIKYVYPESPLIFRGFL